MAFVAPAVCQIGCGAALAAVATIASSPLVLGGVFAMAGYATFKTIQMNTLVSSGEDHKTTLKTSGEDHKTTLVSSGEDHKTTLVSSGELEGDCGGSSGDESAVFKRFTAAPPTSQKGTDFI